MSRQGCVLLLLLLLPLLLSGKSEKQQLHLLAFEQAKCDMLQELVQVRAGWGSWLGTHCLGYGFYGGTPTATAQEAVVLSVLLCTGAQRTAALLLPALSAWSSKAV